MELPVYGVSIVCVVLLIGCAAYRLDALFKAGHSREGGQRWAAVGLVVLVDVCSFVAAATLLRLKPFPFLMSGCALAVWDAILLGSQWYFRRLRESRPGQTTVASLREGARNLQNVALGSLYDRVEGWALGQFQKSRWRTRLIYQILLVGFCFLLSALDALQGGWLYSLFAIGWQSAWTLVAWWRVDRPDLWRSFAPAGSAPHRTRFCTRQDFQALLALTAGVWCGFFDRVLGFWYGFAAVTAFRTLLRLASPLASGIMTRMAPPALQAYLGKVAAPPLWSVRYFRSREFWYGPGMGMVGGLIGSALRYLVFNR